MNRWAYSGIGVLAYFTVLIVTAPASLLTLAAAAGSKGTVSMASPRGSVWRGDARLFVGRGTKAYSLGDVFWRVEPWRLLTGQLRSHVKISAPDVNLDGTISLGIGQLSLHEFHAAFPADLIAKVYPPAEILDPQGAVRIEGSELKLGRRNASGELRMNWRDAGSNMTRVQPLGDYELQVSGRGDSIALNLQTQKGSLNVTGRGTWRLTDGRFQFNGQARPAARAAELEPLLQLLGPDHGGGARTISLNLPTRS